MPRLLSTAICTAESAVSGRAKSLLTESSLASPECDGACMRASAALRIEPMSGALGAQPTDTRENASASVAFLALEVRSFIRDLDEASLAPDSCRKSGNGRAL